MAVRTSELDDLLLESDWFDELMSYDLDAGF
jgi:hypothetical protein